jgi:hypothetical protein
LQLHRQPQPQASLHRIHRLLKMLLTTTTFLSNP